MLHKDPSLTKNAVVASEDDRLASNISQSSLEITNLNYLEGEKVTQQIDEIPYFPEKYPGKLCCLCNLGERSLLGQGELLRLEGGEAEAEFMNVIDKEDNNMVGENYNTHYSSQLMNRKIKNANKCKNGLNSLECSDELDKIGQNDILSFSCIQDGQYYYVHRMCATWSLGVIKKSNGMLENLKFVVIESLKRKCWFCNQYGASVACRMSCPKVFHLPCAAASGCFLIIENFTTFCSDHLNQIPLICAESNIECRHCSELGDISKLITCCACGDHYHSMCIGLANLPGTRSGWQCSSCSKCQICRQPDNNDGRLLKCEQCHKIYHAYCLRPIISSIPKFGWKCRRCRICSDCGSRTPGAGASSRWHSHYTVCDSCYQQRNKGFSCPICHKAYRAAAYKEMVKCSWCSRFVHGTCDTEADLSMYHLKKENDPDYDYVCPPCKTTPQGSKSIKNSNHIRFAEGDHFGFTSPSFSSVGSFDSFCKDIDAEFDDKYKLNPKGKPFDSFKLSKKRMTFKDLNKSRPKFIFQKRTNFSDFGRKRGSKVKVRNLSAGGCVSQLSTDHNTNRNESDPATENKLVLCSAKDKYVLLQDICVMCGSIGIDQEGCLISCSQCGQCYHPYCVNIKISKIILQKGWRCLDCTVCEGCGQKNDEARLILCDECDISYHIYCMNPPLETVPHGNWKCRWCSLCQKCGRNNSGKNSQWKNNYSECGPCFSKITCCYCSMPYNENELIIQCSNCERWLHCKCDSIKSEEEAERCDNDNYICVLCRPKDIPPPHLISSQINSTLVKNTVNANGNDISEISRNAINSENLHFIDGVYINDHGLQQIKSLQVDIKKKRKLKPITGEHIKDIGIIATIESVVAGASMSSSENSRKESQEVRDRFENYKDGKIWDSTETNIPDGFSLFTNDEGVCLLRKKRQRNLQKVGIGGFNVKNRTVKKEIVTKDLGEENGEYIHLMEPEKKKKIVRKKIKNKLVETYPTYLQEAFFGKTLLDVEKLPYLESDSCESSEIKASVVSDDIFLPFSICELNLVKNTKKEIHSNYSESENTFLSESNTECQEIDSFAERTQESPLNKNDLKLTVKIKDEEKNAFVESVKKESVDFSLQLSSEPFLKRQVLIKNNSEICPQKIDETKYMLQKNETVPMRNSLLASPLISNFVAQGVSNHNEEETDDSRCQPQLNETQKLTVSPYVNSVVKLEEIPGQDAQDHHKEQLKTFHQHQIVTGTVQKTTEETNEVIVAGTQKTAEKMRRDEDLGDMATISAVLYANTQHPELKQMYPQWSDRCKQILKQWRSLSTEKKAPFLQHAKDNRSALRMRRAQQDQEKTCSQQKAIKEQEQERMWKQYQAKAKESIVCKLNESGGNNDFSIESFPAARNNKDTVAYTSFSNFQVNGIQNTAYDINIKSSDNSVGPRIIERGVDSENNKQLRNLLEKPDSNTEFESRFVTSPSLKFESTSHVGKKQPRDYYFGKRSSEEDSLRKISQHASQNKYEGSSNKAKYDLKIAESSDNVPADIEKLVHDENTGIGDILGGLEGDDDELLKSLTAEMGDDFNILEYADPELDEFATNQNLLNKLDFDENDRNT